MSGEAIANKILQDITLNHKIIINNVTSDWKDWKKIPEFASYVSEEIKDKDLVNEAKDPAKGTGKKPKGSGRRLYTDEDPSDTVSVKFKTKSDIQDTLSKKSFKSKSHQRQSQIINLIHQRVRAAYKNAKDPATKKRLKRAYDYAEERKESSKKKTKRMRGKK